MNPFLGAGLGRMAEGISSGVANAPLLQRMMQRQDTQDQQQARLTDEQLASEKQRQKMAFLQGGINFWKMTRNKDAFLKFWNEKGTQYGWPKLDDINPEPDGTTTIKHGDSLYSFDENDKANPIKKIYDFPKSAEQQSKEKAAQIQMDIMNEGDEDQQAAAAGVKMPRTEKTPKPEMTPSKANTELTKLAVLEGHINSPTLTKEAAEAIGRPELVYKEIPPEDKKIIKDHIAKQRAYLQKFVSGGGEAGQATQKIEQKLQGRPLGTYRNTRTGEMVKWDGTKVVQ